MDGDVPDMSIKEEGTNTDDSTKEGDDSVVEWLKGEEDSWCDCDGIDRFEEDVNSDGWFWKYDGLDCDAIDM